MRKESLIARATERASLIVAQAIDRAAKEMLDSYGQEGNLRHIVGKNLKDLTPQEYQYLLKVYHREGEVVECQFCRWQRLQMMRRQSNG